MTASVQFPSDDFIQLHPTHEEWRAANYPTLTPAWFAYMVGNRLSILPEKNLEPKPHLPVVRLGSRNGNGVGWSNGDLMVVLPFVYEMDLALQAALTTASGIWLEEQLQKAGIDLSGCLATHALRFSTPPGMSYGQIHKSANQPYVQADCYACAPRAILTFGADALKALFGNDAKLDKMRGSVHAWNDIPVIPTVSPLTFATSHGGLDVFQSELVRAMQVICKGYVPAKRWYDGYRVCETVDQVEELERLLEAEKATWISIDTEFGNDTGREEHNYILTFQLSWGPGKAALIKLRGEKGVKIHQDDVLARIKASITRMMNRQGVRLIGHHLRVDVQMAYREGMDFQDRLEDGFDTMLAHWILYGGEGDESHGLDHLVRRYEPDVGAYWMELENWLDSKPTTMVQKRKRGTEELVFETTKVKDPETGKVMTVSTGVPVMVERKWSRSSILEYGYRMVPHDILVPYALLDADLTYRIAMKLMAELDQQPKLAQLFRTYVMPISLHLMDVEQQGIRVDLERIKQLREMYQPEYDTILAEFQRDTCWPGFNPNSSYHKAAFLFSTTQYRGKKPAPEGALCLELKPLYNTDKYPKEWTKIEAAGEQERNAPSTKAATLDLLYQRSKLPLLKRLKHLSVLGKFLSTYLVEVETNEHGYRKAGKNIANNIWDDGRVRGHFNQMTATGRYSMRAANLQTNPKRQEEAVLEVFVDRRMGGMTPDEYKRRTNDKKKDKLGADWLPPAKRLNLMPFKTVFIPDSGKVFIEVDFKTAEICIWAYCSGDKALIDIIAQGRDLHAEMAAIAFQLPILATMDEAIAAAARGDLKTYEAWVDELKTRWPELRVAAKTVNFGVMYGRAEYALSREISKATNKDVSPQDCTKIIQGLATRFPVAWKWLQDNMALAIEQGYVENAFGFRRYFHGIKELSESQQAAARREASNSPIQGTVAFLLGKAGILLRNYRYRTPVGQKIGYKVNLPIHDAFLIEVDKRYVEEMKQIIRLCMSEYNRIPGTDRCLDVDIEVFPYRWGEKKSKEEMEAFLLDLDEEDEEELVA